MTKTTASLVFAACILFVAARPIPVTARPIPVTAPTRAADASALDSAIALDPLRQFSQSIESLVKRVSPSVVQVLVTAYGPVEDHDQNETDLVGRQRTMGSGVVIDSDGYIVTNAHVVRGAQRVSVVLPGVPSDGPPIRSLRSARGQTVGARVIGVAREVDLALLKIDVQGLPALPMADYDTLRQGELVFAFGSPEGLRNSVTMGVVSAVARQPDSDRAMVFIQTDAPINHGNSGGPLVNVKGELVGINTFILTESGGSQGLGFAIPSAVVSVAYPQLRENGRLRRGEMGMGLQTITPEVARGLGLSQDWGVIVSDILPDSPAEMAGVRPQDIIINIDGKPVDSLPLVAFHMYTKKGGDEVTLRIVRGEAELVLNVPVIERREDVDRLADLVDPDKSRVQQLGVVCVDIDDRIQEMLPALRIPSGVIVAARIQDPRAADVILLVGDVIHSLNGAAISSVQGLQSALDHLETHSSVVLQVERAGKLSFVGFELD